MFQLPSTTHSNASRQTQRVYKNNLKNTMKKELNVLIIIPARGGSKGIPKKNIRLMNGKPLISYAIQTALASSYHPDVYVSTDSDEIADISAKYGAKIIKRDESLAGDAVTLDPVIYDALLRAEREKGLPYNLIITIQPTSPLTKTTTLDNAIRLFIKKKCNTIISVVNKPHLSWKESDEKNITPNYTKRLNRQQLPKNYLETGAFVITDRSSISSTTRFGKDVCVYEVPEEESIDIDNEIDWIATESLMKRKKIIFRADGYIKLGMGHIYNCITLAQAMIGHDILFVTREACELGLRKIQNSLFKYKTIKKESELFDIVSVYKPDIFVNDCLNTNKAYIEKLKKLIPRVISIEDLGSGAFKADAVINALYDAPENATNRFYSGHKYVCLRDEFFTAKPTGFSKKVKKIVILFGGTDPSNLNKKVYSAAKKIHKKHPDIFFYFITGIGYDYKTNGVTTDKENNIIVCPNVPLVTKYMDQADIAVTGQGRTIYELASLGIPSIVLSQNNREKTHTFANLEHGFLNLGLGSDIDASTIASTLSWLIDSSNVRKNMHELMLHCDLKSGLNRCKKIILGEYDD